MCYSCQQLAAIIIIKSCSAFTLPLCLFVPPPPGTLWLLIEQKEPWTSSSFSSLAFCNFPALAPLSNAHTHERSLCHARIVIKCWTLIGVRSCPTTPPHCLPTQPLFSVHRRGCLCVRHTHTHTHECKAGASPCPTAHRSVCGAPFRLPPTVEPRSRQPLN